MKPHPDFIAGLSVLEPFLKSHGFFPTGLKTEYEPEGIHTDATFTNGDKRFMMGYRHSITFIAYQCGNSIVNHGYYLDGLGFSEQRLAPGFQSEDKLLGFRNILHDFAFIVNDFFKGDCKNLKLLAAALQESVTERNKKATEEFRKQPDLRTIREARQLYKEKKYFECLVKYLEINQESLLTKLDATIIHYCRNQQF